MKKILRKTALAAVLFMPILTLSGCPDSLSQGAAQSACMQNLIGAGKVNSANYEYYKQGCAQAAH